MARYIHGHAIPRLDGSDQDGVHLMWTAPDEAGYSVKGFDLQRRESQRKFEEICYTLTQPEFTILHQELRVDVPFGRIKLRSANCSARMPDIPDEPFRPGSRKICIDYSEMPSTSFPNPRLEQGASFKVNYQNIVAINHKSKGKQFTKQHYLDEHHGLDGGNRMEISLDEPSDFISIELYTPRSAAKVRVYSNLGKILEIRNIYGSIEAQVLNFHIENIMHLVVDVSQDHWLLKRLCYNPKSDSCAVFKQAGIYQNPYINKGYKFEVFSRNGKALKQSEVVAQKRHIGLNTGYRLDIGLPSPVNTVSLSIAFFASPPTIELLDVKGKVFDKHTPETNSGNKAEINLKAKTPILHLRIRSPQAEVLVLCICPPEGAPKEKKRESIIDMGSVLSSMKAVSSKLDTRLHVARATTELNTPKVCLRYTITFKRMHAIVRLKAGYGAYLLVAFSQGKAVYTQLLGASNAPVAVNIENKFVDELWIYMGVAISFLRICVDEELLFDNEESSWASVPFLAKGLQLPLKQFNPSLSNNTDEENLAKSRVIGAELWDQGAFRKMADMLNTAGKNPKQAPPLEFFTRTKDRVADPPIDLHTWPYGMATIIKPAWRRALGFGFLDPDKELSRGKSYDYRISGYFQRRDIEEKLLSFRTIPDGLLLPFNFSMGPLSITTHHGMKITHFPNIPESALQRTARKGVRVQEDGLLGFSLKLNLADPITEIVLELEPSQMNNFRYKAEASSVFPGLSGVFAEPVPEQERVQLSFEDPVSEIHFFGSALIYGFRLNPVSPGMDPNEIIKKSVILYNVVYIDTPKPVAPSFVGTQNLQQTAIVGNPESIVTNPRNDMGFTLRWIPPLNGSSSGTLWPEDLAAFPPFDVLGFHLERKRIDLPEPFLPIDGAGTDTLFLGSREGPSDLPQVSYGADIMVLFPLVRPPTPPIAVYMKAQDVLYGSETRIGVPGGLYQYRIFSVDILDRKSSIPTNGSIVRLEKRVAPPPPGAPNLPNGTEVGFAGVRASVLQASDPELSAADESILGTSANAIVLDWGWSAEQRRMDPFAREFRVYWQSVVPDQVKGSFTGPSFFAGAFYEMPASLDKTIPADTFSGKYIRAGDYPFKIHSHSAGLNVTFKLELSQVDSSRLPQQGSFVLNASLNGEDVRPNRWQTRASMVSITAEENYRHIFRDLLSLDADNPRQRIWVGVSAADNQYYIPDELPSAALNGNRAGNESSIAVGYAQARYFGRPIFNVPPPLEDVPEIPTDEPVSKEVAFTLDLPAVYGTTLSIPAGHKVLLEQISSAVLLNMIAATASDQIEARLPDGSIVTYTLGNPTDQGNFLSQIREGTAQAIEGKFIMNFLIRFKSEIDTLWKRVISKPVSYSSHELTVSSDPERYFYQLRLVDAAGHVSEAGALMPSIVRVRNTRVPDPPSITAKSSDDEDILIKLDFRDQFDLKWVVIFAHEADIDTIPDDTTLKKAQLLRLPNRMDLYPNDGLRIRLSGGIVLTPIFSGLADSGDLEDNLRKMEVELSLNLDKRVALWAVLFTRDGIASRAVGPVMVTTGPELPIAPTLVSTRNGNVDEISWLAPAIEARVFIERNLTGNWERISPWLPEGSTGYSSKSPAVDRSYRLCFKARRGVEVTSNALVINEP